VGAPAVLPPVHVGSGTNGTGGKTAGATWLPVYRYAQILSSGRTFNESATSMSRTRPGCLRVRRVCFDENVDVRRKAGLRVKDHGVTANNQVSNAMGMEGGQKVFVVLVNPAPSPNP